MLTFFVVTWLVTALSLLLISRLGIGIDLEDGATALVAALVIGLINAFVRPLAQLFALPLTVLTLGLFALVVNALLFWLAAALVSGFRLRNGFVSALVGSLLLGLLNAILLGVLGALGIP